VSIFLGAGEGAASRLHVAGTRTELGLKWGGNSVSSVMTALNLLCDEHLLNRVLVKLVHQQE
jgi:hypothetical protein